MVRKLKTVWAGYINITFINLNLCTPDSVFFYASSAINIFRPLSLLPAMVLSLPVIVCVCPRNYMYVYPYPYSLNMLMYFLVHIVYAFFPL